MNHSNQEITAGTADCSSASRLTARQHAQRIIDNYLSHGLGDPKRSDDHAVAAAVGYQDLYEQHENVSGIAMYELDNILDHCCDQTGWRMKIICKSAERVLLAFRGAPEMSEQAEPEDIESGKKISRAEFDEAAIDKRFIEGPFVSSFGDGPCDPYVPQSKRTVWGRLPDGPVWATGD